MPRYREFVFEGYRFDPQRKELRMDYSLDDAVRFREAVRFDFPFKRSHDRTALDAAFQGLFLMAGISYYKTYVPPTVRIKSFALRPSQARFFEKAYRHGLGEFCYVNELDPVRVRFPSERRGRTVGGARRTKELRGALVPVGGGKDSITTAELLKAGGKGFATWTVGDYPFFGPMLKRIGKPHLHATRKLSPKLFELNRKGAYNGHVPISGILAFMAAASAILTGRRDVVMSNEHSAEEPNVRYRGLSINHQYSKSFAFEQDFRRYLTEHVSPDLRYFSLLRPYGELKIAKLFAERYADKYRGNFSSCNRNFHIGHRRRSFTWCGECPKCAFVFASFAAFMPKDRLIGIFGKNLFTDPSLRPLFDELIGTHGHKPFECVGEIRETRKALELARRSGEYPELDSWDIPASRVRVDRTHANAVPPEYRSVLKKTVG